MPNFLSCVGRGNKSSTNSKKPKKNEKKSKNSNTLTAPSAPRASNIDVSDTDTDRPEFTHSVNLRTANYDTESIDSLDKGERNFWQLNHYKVALKRCENGYKLASELNELISDRAKIEDNYGKSLQQW
jgi:hypothetical protein